MHGQPRDASPRSERSHSTCPAIKEPVGDLWLQVEASPDGLHAFGCWLEVRQDLRQRGRSGDNRGGGAEVPRDERSSIGQTVFGSNKAAQTLYEDLGFKPTVLQMCRRLSPI